MPKGKILDVEDGGTIWMILYKPKNGTPHRVVSDWRQFAHFYEGTSGRSFYHDYRFGEGRDLIKSYFRGKTLVVDGDPFEETVSLGD